MKNPYIWIGFQQIGMFQEARSALHLAAESGNADICEMLLAKNAYVNSKTKAGWTPLHYVAYNGFNELIHPLVTKHNAAIDATSMVSFFDLLTF